MSTTYEDITEATRESYEAIPYPGGAYLNTFPCHLAMIAKLCGLAPAPPRNCRVLELGCSMGTNLIPMALELPHSTFVGIDLSAGQIEQGRATLADLDIDNVELHQLNIAEVDDRLGKFDYILCHGVYSWVPPEVQRAILDLGRTHLTPQGIQMVSYNTYPGWHLRGVIREMMRYHVAHFSNPQQQIQQARALLDFVSKYARSRSQAYLTLLEEEAKTLGEKLDSYVYHEHLEEVNDPVYFHEFVRRVEAAGLSYLADANFASMLAQKFDESVAELLRHAPLVRREQYMDFLSSRTFRSSLLCHQTQVPDYSAPAQRLASMFVTLKQPFRKKTNTPQGVLWEHPEGKLTTQDPVTGVVERLQRDCRCWISVQELLDEMPPGSDAQAVLDSLLISFANGVIWVSDDPPRISREVAEKPLSTSYGRWQAQPRKRRYQQVSYRSDGGTAATFLAQATGRKPHGGAVVGTAASRTCGGSHEGLAKR